MWVNEVALHKIIYHRYGPPRNLWTNTNEKDAVLFFKSFTQVSTQLLCLCCAPSIAISSTLVLNFRGNKDEKSFALKNLKIIFLLSLNKISTNNTVSSIAKWILKEDDESRSFVLIWNFISSRHYSSLSRWIESDKMRLKRITNFSNALLLNVLISFIRFIFNETRFSIHRICVYVFLCSKADNIKSRMELVYHVHDYYQIEINLLIWTTIFHPSCSK